MANDVTPHHDATAPSAENVTEALALIRVEYEWSHEVLRRALAGLQARAAEAERDKKRLDWLDAHEMTIRADYDGACFPPWSVYYEQAAGAHNDLRGEGDSLRDAIDAAMRSTAPPAREPEPTTTETSDAEA